MPRNRGAYLWDVLEAIRLIEAFTAEKSLEDYSSNAMLRAAVEREFEIIGEALTQGVRFFPELSSQLSQFEQIVSFRNRLIHGYRSISNDIVWSVIEEDLPVLKREAETLLSKP